MVFTRQATVKAPKHKVWSFLQDTETVGKCIPGTESVIVSDGDSSKWKLKIGVGMVSRRIEARVKRFSDEEKGKMSFDILSTDGDLQAKINATLGEDAEGETTIRIDFDARASGSFSWIVNQIITKQSDKMISQFIDCINVTIATKH